MKTAIFIKKTNLNNIYVKSNLYKINPSIKRKKKAYSYIITYTVRTGGKLPINLTYIVRSNKEGAIVSWSKLFTPFVSVLGCKNIHKEALNKAGYKVVSTKLTRILYGK